MCFSGLPDAGAAPGGLTAAEVAGDAGDAGGRGADGVKLPGAHFPSPAGLKRDSPLLLLEGHFITVTVLDVKTKPSSPPSSSSSSSSFQSLFLSARSLSLMDPPLCASSPDGLGQL